MQTRRRALGKGLEQLFSNERINFQEIEETIVKNTDEKDISEIPVDEIRSNPYQPRKIFNEEALKELAASIEVHGVVQPIIVKKSIKGYELIAGERRTRAAKLAGLTTIPAIVKDFSDDEMMEIALIENIQRENLNVLEEAIAYDKIIKTTGVTQEVLAKKFGKSRSYITNIIGILRLPEQVQKLIAENKISMGHARSLSKLEDNDKIIALADSVIKDELSVRQLEEMLRENVKLPKKVNRETRNQHYLIYENVLSEKIGSKVKIDNFKIEISFDSGKDLERILEILNVDIEGE